MTSATDRQTLADGDDLERSIERAFRSYTLPMQEHKATPAHSQGRRRWYALAAAAVATLVVVVPIATRPSAVFATWSVDPNAPDLAIVAAVDRMCHPPIGPDVSARERAFQARMATLPLAVVDQRGRAAMLMYASRAADGIAIKLCLGAVDENGTVLGGGSADGVGGIEEPADGPVRVVSSSRNTRYGPDIWSHLSGGETYTAYGGTIEPGVERVTVERSDGVSVEASVGEGFFAVWWPGDGDATAFSALDRDGLVLAELDSGGWSFPE